MKKVYIIPELEKVLMDTEMPLSASGVTSNVGIDYGGIDEKGEQEPSVKGNSFDFEWE